MDRMTAPGMESKKLISATDTQHAGILLKALNEQRALGLFCDITLIVEDKKFRAHRSVLSASSTYFHQLFSVAGQVVELNFVRAEIFAEILGYIYSSKLVRVKADLLEELIKAGQLLGVRFIADLGVPLSQVKSMAREGKDTSEPLTSKPEGSSPDTSKASAGQDTKNVISQVSAEEMPIITDAFSLSGNGFKNSKQSSNSHDCEDSDDDDVIFCSELTPTKHSSLAASNTMLETLSTPNSAEDFEKKVVSTGLTNPPLQVCQSSNGFVQHSSLNVLGVQKQTTPDFNQSSSCQINNTEPCPSSSSSILQEQTLSQSILYTNTTTPVNHSVLPGNLNTVMQSPHPPNSNHLSPSLVGASSSLASTPVLLSNSSSQQKVPQSHSLPGRVRIQKKPKITFLQHSSHPGEFKIRISGVGSNSVEASDAKQAMDGKKVITLDKGSEIGALSTSCKVYANIGENTYDIVIPVKDDPDEQDTSRNSADSPTRKRLKLKHDDHYELVVDGRVYYICVVCKRSYVCLTSLKRHFNVHSWEKKYPCHYCDRVFPLAEYRTKHEIHHTGERRYQCLTCNESFINYQVMASHIRSAHSQDPTGDNKLYRLHPCKTLQIRQYSYVTDDSFRAPVENDAEAVYHIQDDKNAVTVEQPQPSVPDKQLSWDDIFIQQGNQAVYRHNSTENRSEFEFVIPESY
ncbi:transcriptional regulator Kaiso [Protopterus annectens]|uniref:transcriptional regulator Kaiso n=1 Tax=Protopterus annectens TaxID=7888 RepID=UPI001CFA9133|nr:transcriptional regulator Kaiso [Protopterus annectens]